MDRGSEVFALFHRLDAVIAQRCLLDHPFYREWNEGKLSLDRLREYARQYHHFESAFPTLLSAVHSRCEDRFVRQVILRNLWDEEHGPENHLALWLRFCEGIGLSAEDVLASEPFPETRSLVDGFRAACFTRPVVEGVAALYAYESQVPAIAERKIDGLKRHYGIKNERTLAFFTVHREVDLEHAEAERAALRAAVRTPDDAHAAEVACRASAERLWLFLDGAHRARA